MTDRSECENLDAFLSDELGDVAAARFEAHLRECAACREAIDEQRWIDGLLCSPVRLQVESAPPAILESYRTSVARRRHVRLAACGVAAAAVLIVAAGWIAVQSRESVRRASVGNASIATAAVANKPPSQVPKATFVSNGDSIAVPLESPAADVSVVQLYPTTDTERRWRRELVLHNTYAEPNGG